jgi:hypothetical protein
VIALSIIIVREFISAYADLNSISPILGITFLIFVLIVFVYFIALPFIQTLKMPKIPSPVFSKSDVPTLMEKRIELFKQSKLINESEICHLSLHDKYSYCVSVLEKEAERIRNNYVRNVFYSTGISQNGFLDGIIILSAGINVIKDIFSLYNGRVSNKDLWTVIRKIYTAMAIGGSEIIQYSTDEIISLITTNGIKQLPLIDKFISSTIDGFVNAIMISRIAIITENYCKLTFIQSNKDLLPNYRIVYDTTKNILGDIFNKIRKTLPTITTNNAIEYAKYVASPFKYIVEKIDSRRIKESSVNNLSLMYSYLIKKLPVKLMGKK